MSLYISRFLNEFRCTGPECPDTCCKGWNMQLDDGMFEKYGREAPELLDAVADDGSGGHIMRRDAATDYCVRFENGLCGIHRQYGNEFLGDACHFYPRSTRGLQEIAIMTATPSCPEAARLALFSPEALAHDEVPESRLPYSLKDYLPAGLTPEAALAVHRAFLAAAEMPDIPPGLAFARIHATARSMERLDPASWAEAVPFYLENVDARLPAPELQPEDPFNLLHALCGLVVAARKARGPRLMETISAMEQMLAARLDWQQVAIATTDESFPRFLAAREAWQRECLSSLAPLLKRSLALQLAVALFPFGGLGGTLSERMLMIGVRLATLTLALMGEYTLSRAVPGEDTIIRVAQSLARALDHLGDSAFSLQVYTEAGWAREARLNGLVML